jgi:TorA maturation chaperone TorD
MKDMTHCQVRKKDRAESFRLLSECYRLPDKEFASLVQALGETVSSLGEEASGYVQKMKKELERTSDITPIAVDYARLFVGPYQLLAAPYGSVYLDEGKKIMGDSTLDVRARYRETGLDVAEDFNDPPDHIAAELEFVYFLMLKDMEASSGEDPEKGLDWGRKRMDFLRIHLGAWAPGFADLVEEKAETSFYRNLARTTRALIRHEMEECVS